MMDKAFVTLLGMAAILTILAVPPVSADAIDGGWCYKDGSRLAVDGPKIITPGGTRMTGDYDRHGFAYTVPPGERGAGTKITMSQLNDVTMHLTPGSGAVQEWHRCPAPTS